MRCCRIAALALAAACTKPAASTAPDPRDAAMAALDLTTMIAPDMTMPAPDTAASPADFGAASSFCTHRASDPPRTIFERPCGTLRAVLTDGARTAVLTGAARVFAEPTAANPVSTTDWVRILPAPYPGSPDAALERWLDGALASSEADVLAMAMQYIEGAPPVIDKGLQIAGDADYGPLDDLEQRLEGADFNDYLGLRWSYPDGTIDRPKSEMLHSLDCSGYMRMLWGYRGGLPLAPAASNTALSRRAVQLDAATFGVTIIANGQPLDLTLLQTGDLVFFDADPGDGPAIDHVGMYLGRDEGGHHRFLSSRKSPNGPTLGDARGASILDGAGLYAKSFRAARRL